MERYFVFVSTKTERGTYYYDELNSAIKKYSSIDMNELKDNVFLGYENSSLDRILNGNEVTESVCFDYVHKFFNESILINDYLNHDCTKVRNILNAIMEKLHMTYQFSSQILNGMLIPFNNQIFVPDKSFNDKHLDDKASWEEIHVYKWQNGWASYGWRLPTRKTFDDFGWSYPTIASYCDLISVNVYNKQNHKAVVDMDIKQYLCMKGAKIS